MIKIFEWTEGWYAAQNGKKITGPHPKMTDVVLELERRKMKPFRQGPPPMTWIRGSEGPKPLKKLLKVVSTVAKVAAIVDPRAAAVAAVADALGKLTIPEVRRAVEKIDSLKALESLRKKEHRGRKRVGVLDAIRARKKALQ